MGWDGVGYRMSRQDLDIVERSSDWVRHLYESRKQFLLDGKHPRNGLVDPQLAWDDMPPIMFDRRRRVRGGHATIVSITPNEANDLPAVLSEALWSAIEGGRAVITTRGAHEMASLMAVQHPEEENRQILELGPREYAEIRRRVVDSGRLENAIIVGDEDPLVFRQCTFSACEFRQCEFQNVIFRQCNFVKSVFYACIFRDCTFEDCDWAETKWGDWWTKTVTITGPEGADTDKEGSVQKRRLILDWASVNNVFSSRIVGHANSIHSAFGIGPAAFMPHRLAEKYGYRVVKTRENWQGLVEEHRLKVRESEAEGKPLTIQAKTRLHSKREVAKAFARWKAGTKQDGENPAYGLEQLRQHHTMDDSLHGFEYAV